MMTGLTTKLRLARVTLLLKQLQTIQQLRLSIFSAAIVCAVVSGSNAFADDGPFLEVPATGRDSGRLTIGKVLNKEAAPDVAVSLNTFEDLQTALKYKIESEPAPSGPWKSRIEHYLINHEGSIALDVIEWLYLPIGFNFHRNSRLLMAEQVSKEHPAARRPLSYKDIPFTAKIAKDRLQPGDFFAFDADMDLSVSVAWAETVVDPLAIGAAAGVIVSGHFNAHLFRMKNNRMRVKLFVEQTKEHKASIQAGANLPIDSLLKVFHISVSKSVTGELVSIFPINAKIKIGDQGLTVADYTFDLNDSEAAKAYDRLMTAQLKLKQIPYRNPFAVEQPQNLQFHDLNATENLAAQDQYLPNERRRVTRNLSLRSVGFSKYTGIEIDLGVVNFEDGTTTSTHRIATYTSNGDTERYVLRTTTARVAYSVFFDQMGKEDYRELSFLTATDKSFKREKLIGFSLISEQKLVPFQAKDVSLVSRHFQKALPRAVAEKIQWPSSIYRSGRVGYLRSAITFQPKVLRPHIGTDPKVISAQLLHFLNGKDLRGLAPFYAPMAPGYDNQLCALISCLENEVHTIATLLANAFYSGYSLETTQNFLEQLMQMPIFHRYGAPFLLSLMSDQELNQTGIHIIVSADTFRPYEFNFGSPIDTDLYQIISRIHGIGSPRNLPLKKAN